MAYAIIRGGPCDGQAVIGGLNPKRLIVAETREHKWKQHGCRVYFDKFGLCRRKADGSLIRHRYELNGGGTHYIYRGVMDA